MKKENSIFGTISLIIIVLLLLTDLVLSVVNFTRVSGIIPVREPKGFINKGEFVSVNANYVKGPVYTISHSMNGVIPMGTEFYYEIIDAETGTVYFVRASKRFEKYENSDSIVNVKGKVRKADSDMSSWMIETNNAFAEAGYQTGFSGTPVYIDNYVKTNSILSIIACICIIGGVGLLAFSPASRRSPATFSPLEKTLVSLFVIIILFGLGLMMYTVTFMF